ncbi:carbon-nitrogen hydrolase, partial [Campylobacter coli]|nr:carbon-nitrogen hydrolase [Campylobacter coli]
DEKEEKQRQLGAWLGVQKGHAIANGLYTIAVNRVGFEEDKSGVEEGIRFWGNSFVFGPQGEEICILDSENECIKLVDIDLQRSENVRRWWPFLRDRRIEYFGDLSKRFID